MTVVGNDVWFEGKDASGNVGLWETDGTAAGTNELVPGLIASNMTAYGNAVYFTGTDGGLWKTDGTPGGTIEIAGAPASSIGQFDPVSNLFSGDTLYLAGDTYNMTAPGPNTYPGGFNFDPSSFDVVNGKLLFSGTVILQNETQDQTPAWARLLFAWNGTSLQVLGAGLFDGGMVNGTGADSGVTYYAAPGYNGELVSSQAINNLVLYGIPDPSFQYLPNSTGGDLLYQTDGTAAGTTFNVVIGTPDGTTYIDGDGVSGFSNLTSVDGSLVYSGFNAGLDGGYDLWVDSAFAPQTAVQITRDGQVYQYATTPDADLVSGVYDPYPTNANPTGEAYPNSLDLFPDAEPNSVGSGFNPTGMTVFDGNVYFSGVNAAGKTELWELVTNTPAEPFWEQTFNASSSQVFLAASGLEFTGINGAYAGGFEPTDITALNITNPTAKSITVGQLLVDETVNQIDPGSGDAPAGEGYIVTDTAFDIESLTPSEITSGQSIGLEAIVSTDAPVELTVEQAEALELSVDVMTPPGDTVTVLDSAGAIQGMPYTLLSKLTGIGVSAILTSGDLQLDMQQALALESENVPILSQPGAAPLVFTVDDIPDDIAPTPAAQLGGLAAIGVSAIATTGDLQLSMAQALALENAKIPIVQQAGSPPVTATVVDSPAHIEPTSATLLGGLASIGVTQIATYGDLQLSMAQTLALIGAGLAIVQETASPPLTVTVADSAAAIEQTSPTLLGEVAPFGVTEIATSGELALSVQQATALEGITIVQGTGAPLQVIIRDMPGQIETLTQYEIELASRPLDRLCRDLFERQFPGEPNHAQCRSIRSDRAERDPPRHPVTGHLRYGDPD